MKYTLETGSKKFSCPNCQKMRFKRYIDTEKNEYLSELVGLCDRINSCGYHLPPKEFFTSYGNNNGINKVRQTVTPVTPVTPKEASFIPFGVVQKTLKDYRKNNFAQFLIDNLGKDIALDLLNKFFVGTAKGNKTIFWQVDQDHKVRTGKVFLYSTKTGKRNREIFPYFVHKKIFKDFNLKQCLFGEFQLKNENKSKTIAVVESEKTAILMTLANPKFIWLACGGIQNLNKEICQSLKNRNVILFPDVRGFDTWKAKSKELKTFCNSVNISETLEKLPNEFNGKDLADFLSFKELESISEKKDSTENQEPSDQNLITILTPDLINPLTRDTATKRESWNLEELEVFFNSVDLSEFENLQLNKWTKVFDVKTFVVNHLEVCRNANGNKTFKAYFDRLHELKEVIEAKTHEAIKLAS